MLVEEALFKLLSEDAGVSALVAARIQPGILSQESDYPAIAYRQVSESSDVVLNAPGIIAIVACRFRFFSVARRYLQCKQLDEAIRQALIGFHGTVTDDSSPQESIDIAGIFPTETAGDDYEDNTQTFQFIRDFTVHAVKTTT